MTTKRIVALLVSSALGLALTGCTKNEYVNPTPRDHDGIHEEHYYEEHSSDRDRPVHHEHEDEHYEHHEESH